MALAFDVAVERKSTVNTVAREMMSQPRFALHAACRLVSSVGAMLFAAWLSSVSAAGTPEDARAAAQYVSNVRRVLESRVLPALRAGIMSVATSKPPALAVDVTDDPSPYHIGARAGADGSLTVRLSIGYLTMHDAALDAVAMSTVMQRREDLRRYLMYQLHLAWRNELQRVRNEPAEGALAFAQFQGIDAKDAQAVYSRPEWHALRDGIETESLGWVVAQLLAQVDPAVSGPASQRAAHDGTGAARLANASGWFPVPPLATALGMAAIERSTAAPFDERALLCRAAQLMEAGTLSVRVNNSRPPSDRDAKLRNRLDDIRKQIAGMRREGRCDPGSTVTAAAPGIFIASTPRASGSHGFRMTSGTPRCRCRSLFSYLDRTSSEHPTCTCPSLLSAVGASLARLGIPDAFPEGGDERCCVNAGCCVRLLAARVEPNASPGHDVKLPHFA